MEKETNKTILSVLFFVTGDWVCIKPEYVNLDIAWPRPPWLSQVQTGIPHLMRESLDQIKSDVQSWVESLKDEKRPVPRKERHGEAWKDEWMVYTPVGKVVHVSGRVVGTFEEYFGHQIPVYAPTKYEAVWTQLYPRVYGAEEIPALCVANSMLELGVSVLTHLSESQPKDFSVYRLEIKKI